MIFISLLQYINSYQMLFPSPKKFEYKNSFKKALNLKPAQSPKNAEDSSFRDLTKEQPRSLKMKVYTLTDEVRNAEINEFLKKSSSKNKIIPKTRMTPPLQRAIKSERKLQFGNGHNPSDNAQCEKLYTQDQMNHQIRKLRDKFQFEISELKKYIKTNIDKIEPRNKVDCQIHDDKEDFLSLRKQRELFKALYSECLAQLHKNNQKTIEIQAKHAREVDNLLAQIQMLKAKLPKTKIDHLFTHNSYDRNNYCVQNKIEQTDQHYQSSNVNEYYYPTNSGLKVKRTKSKAQPNRNTSTQCSLSSLDIQSLQDHSSRLEI